jgi:hypothetical protein
MKRLALGILIALAVCGTAHAQQTPTDAVVAHDDTAQLKATIIKLQKAVLALRKENGMLQATVAELQDAALEAAIDTMDPEVKKALGRPEPKATPAETSPPKR